VLAGFGELPADEVLLSDIVIRSADGEQRLAGRVVAEGTAGELLLEDPAGRMRQLSGSEVVGREDRRGVWQPADAEQLGQLLKTEAGSGFEVYQTEHYLVCSNCSEGYNEFIGRLLETVHAQYFDFWKKLKVDVVSAGRPLPVLMFQSESEFQSYAGRIHPETGFEGVPGFYSVRDNLVLVVDLTRDRSWRIVRCRWRRWCMRRCINCRSIRGCSSGLRIFRYGIPRDYHCILSRLRSGLRCYGVVRGR
jgi:hypothetical protein